MSVVMITFCAHAVSSVVVITFCAHAGSDQCDGDYFVCTCSDQCDGDHFVHAVITVVAITFRVCTCSVTVEL